MASNELEDPVENAEPVENNDVDRAFDDGDEPGNELDDLAVASFGSPVADRVHALLAPVISTVGVDLVDVEWSGGTLRLAVEELDGEEGITTDSLAQVNRLVSPLLDQHDPVPGRYTLEVSSPGVERPLRRVDHFERAVGEVVIVKMIPGHDPRRFRGLLRSFAEGQLVLDVDEIDGVGLAELATEEVAMADIASARTHFDWGPTPKKGGKGSGQKRAKATATNRPKPQTGKQAKGHANKAKQAGKSNKAGKSNQAGKNRAKGPNTSKQQANTTEEERGRT